jgi:hypothetical protein
LVRNDGQLHYRDGGEAHLNTPGGMAHLQVRTLYCLSKSENNFV